MRHLIITLSILSTSCASLSPIRTARESTPYTRVDRQLQVQDAYVPVASPSPESQETPTPSHGDTFVDTCPGETYIRPVYPKGMNARPWYPKGTYAVGVRDPKTQQYVPVSFFQSRKLARECAMTSPTLEAREFQMWEWDLFF